MTAPVPEDPGRPSRRGLVGPFSGRQLLATFVAVVLAAVALVALTTPLGETGGTRPPPDPRSTPFIIGEAPSEGLRPGDLAPDFTVPLEDGTTYRLTDLDGNPIRMSDLRGKAVWINFWASWCPPCQAETPVLRELAAEYRDQGLELVAISVQETSVDDVTAYAERYELDFTIGFDASGHVFRLYRVYALPTQFFVGTDGVIRSIVQGPLDRAGAVSRIEEILPVEAATR